MFVINRPGVDGVFNENKEVANQLIRCDSFLVIPISCYITAFQGGRTLISGERVQLNMGLRGHTDPKTVFKVAQYLIKLLSFYPLQSTIAPPKSIVTN